MWDEPTSSISSSFSSTSGSSINCIDEYYDNEVTGGVIDTRIIDLDPYILEYNLANSQREFRILDKTIERYGNSNT